jgi:hypothetical protein
MSDVRSYPIGREFSKDEYVKAFTTIQSREKIPENILQMLQNHYAAPEKKLTPTQLADSVGYKHYSAVNLHYGKLGRVLCEELAYIPPLTNHGDPTWTCGLAWGERATHESEWVWTMYENLANATRELGIVK